MDFYILLIVILAGGLVTTSALLIRQRTDKRFSGLQKSSTVAEDELERYLSLLKGTIESTADGILVVDLTGKVVLYNRRFTQMWNIPDDLMNRRKDEELLKYVTRQLKEPEQFLGLVKKLYREPAIKKSDIIEFSDGRFFERFSQPQVINGKTVGRVWSFRDITNSKKAEAQIIAAKEKAEESDRLKTAFLHNVSHEIRTPMNAIIGFSTLLNEKGLDEHERRQYTDFIFQSARQLLSIINDIIDIANIESGRSRVDLKKMNVNSTLKMINDQFKLKERSPGVELELRISLPDNEAEIISDETKLIQIISNLLSNSIKFTSSGSIEFGYVSKDSSLKFFVNDTGIGIQEEQQKRIFDRFYQVDDAASRQYGGTGLGLSICKAYVGLLGGEITLKSKPGEGSSFTFTIPYKPHQGSNT